MHDDRLRDRARRLRQQQTVAERELWQLVRGNQINGWGFRRQAPLGGYVVDFLCHALKLVLEVDGPVHERAEQVAFDAKRDAALAALGYAVVRLDEEIVRTQPQVAVAQIRFIGDRLLRGLSAYPEDEDE